MDFAATTVQLPDGERVPFLFTCKQLLAKGEGKEFKPGFTWGGEFMCLHTELVVSWIQKDAVCTPVMTRQWHCQLLKQMAKKDKMNSSKRQTRSSTLARAPLKWK